MAKSNVAKRSAKSEASVPSTADVKALTGKGTKLDNALASIPAPPNVGKFAEPPVPSKTDDKLTKGQEKTAKANETSPLTLAPVVEGSNDPFYDIGADKDEKAIELRGKHILDLAAEGEKINVTLFSETALLCADIVVFAFNNEKDHSFNGETFDFNVTPEALVNRIVTVANSYLTRIEGYVPPTMEEKKDRNYVDRADSRTSMIKAYLPRAAESAWLLLKGHAKFGLHAVKTRVTIADKVLPMEDVPEWQNNSLYARCIAAPYSSLRPVLRYTERKTVAGVTEKIPHDKPNNNHSIVYLSADNAHLLFLRKTKMSETMLDDSGWLAKNNTGKSGGNSGQTGTGDQGKRTDLKPKSAPELLETPFDTFSQALKEKFAAKNENGTVKYVLATAEQVALCQAFGEYVERTAGIYRTNAPSYDIADALEQIADKLNRCVFRNEKKELYWIDENLKKIHVTPGEPKADKQNSDPLGVALVKATQVKTAA